MTPAETLRGAAAKLRTSMDLPDLKGEIDESSIETLSFIVDLLRAREPLAASLDAIADEMESHGAVEGSASKTVHAVSFLGLGGPRADWTAALTVARAILGEVNHER